MKVERPPHHKPVIEEDVASSSDVSGDDISECLSRLTIYNVDNSKTGYNILVDRAKKEVDEVKKEKKEDKKEGDDKKEERKEGDENKGEEVKKELLGELCARGPVGLDSKWKSQTRASVLPYSTHLQSNSNLSNGGSLLFDCQSTISHPELFALSPLYYTAETSQQFNIAPLTTSEINTEDLCSQSIYEQSDLNDILATSDFLQQTTYSNTVPGDPYSPEIEKEDDLKKCIEEITSDPIKKQNVMQVITSQVFDLFDPFPDLQTNTASYNLQEQISPYSPPQVVPQRRPSISSPSAYSTCSGSPSGPSSPNVYTPTFSPNIPSPQINPYDESSNLMNSSPPFCTSILQSPLQHPLSPCSSTSTNCSSTDLELLDKNVLYCNHDNERKKKIQEIQQYLDTSCSQDYSINSKANYASSAPSINHAPSTNSSIVVVFSRATNQSSSQIKPKSDGSHAAASHGFRLILPKPIDKAMSSPQGESSNTWDPHARQLVKQGRLAQNQSKYSLPVKEQLLQRLNPAKKARAWVKVQSRTDEEIATVDDDGDTALMILVCHKDILQNLEQLYALVERYKTVPEVLSARNNDGHSALYLACMFVSHEPLVAKYIAEALVDVNFDLNVVEHDGTTLIHQLCQKGDAFAGVLDQLLSLRDNRGKPCFDINKFDLIEGRTPLHLSVEMHNNEVPCQENVKISCGEIVKVLLRNGANVLEKDRKQGSTALHLALASNKVDKSLIFTLCNFFYGNQSITDNVASGTESKVKFDLVNAKNFKGDTPLHVAMAFGGNIESQTHNYILEILMGAGATRAVRNNNGKAPLELAPESRKGEIKKILDKYNVK